jgi:hypothetical protein
MAALIFIGLNVIDAWLTRIDLALEAFELSPLVPPFAANLMTRGLVAIVIILIFYLIKKEGFIWWANLLMLVPISWHFIARGLSSLIPPI